MAGLFEQGGLLGALAPNVTGMINPLSMMGAAMYSGNPGAVLGQVGNLQLQAQQVKLNQLAQLRQAEQMREQQRQWQEQQGLARDRLAEIQRHNLAMEAPQPTAAERNLQMYAGLSPEMQEMYRDINVGQGTTVNVGAGSIPSGFTREQTEEGGTRLVPEPGGPEYTKRMEGIQALQGVYNDIAELESLVEKHGTEAYGPVSRRMASLRNRIVGNLPTVRETGVLQEGELKRIEQELPSGDSWLTPGSTILPLLGGFREEVGRKLQTKRDIYGMPGEDTGMSAEQAEEAIPQDVPRISNDTEYDALPSGAVYIDPNGVRRRKR